MSAKKALLAVLASLLILAVLALFIPIDAPWLGREVEERVRSATGVGLEVSRTRIHLLRGLLLEDLSASASFVAGTCEVHVPRMILEHRLLALLRGRLEVTGMKLEEARIGWPGGSVSVEGLGLTLSRLDYDPRALTPLHGLRSEGLLTLRRLGFGGGELRDITAAIATGRGRVQLEALWLATDRGALSGELALDFNSLPFRYRASLLGPSFELPGVGRGRLRLEAEGFGTRTRNLEGKGAFELERGRLPNVPWVREIDPALAGAEHAPAAIVFEVRDERVRFERFELEVGENLLELEGSFGLDGSRDLSANLSRRRD